MDVSEKAVRQKYSFINQSTTLIPTIYKNYNGYLPVSCLLISQICRGGMLTADNLIKTSTSVSVRLLYNDLWQMFWNGYVSFSQLANSTQGTNAINISNQSMSLLDKFSNWDEALQPNPFSDIGKSFSSLLQGVNP